MNKKNLLVIFTAVFLGWSTIAQAVCPVCVVAVGACVGLAQWLGIDDSITGLWIGGLILSLVLWTVDWLNKRAVKFPGLITLVGAVYYLIIVVPLYWIGIMGHPLNKIWGIDRLLFGIIFGSVVFVLASQLHNYLKRQNGGKSYFPLQKVVFPVATLTILSLIFYFVC